MARPSGTNSAKQDQNDGQVLHLWQAVTEQIATIVHKVFPEGGPKFIMFIIVLLGNVSYYLIFWFPPKLLRQILFLYGDVIVLFFRVHEVLESP